MPAQPFSRDAALVNCVPLFLRVYNGNEADNIYLLIGDMGVEFRGQPACLGYLPLSCGS